MYLYTARFSRRRCESERGTDVREHPNTRVFAVVLSHSRIYLRRGDYSGGWRERGLSQKCFTLTSPATHESRCEEGYKTKKTVWFYFSDSLNSM